MKLKATQEDKMRHFFNFFRIVQDLIGGHSFTWPSNVRNGGSVNKTANARSIQMFVVDLDGSLDAVGPMMYS